MPRVEADCSAKAFRSERGHLTQFLVMEYNLQRDCVLGSWSSHRVVYSQRVFRGVGIWSRGLAWHSVCIPCLLTSPTFIIIITPLTPWRLVPAILATIAIIFVVPLLPKITLPPRSPIRWFVPVCTRIAPAIVPNSVPQHISSELACLQRQSQRWLA